MINKKATGEINNNELFSIVADMTSGKTGIKPVFVNLMKKMSEDEGNKSYKAFFSEVMKKNGVEQGSNENENIGSDNKNNEVEEEDGALGMQDKQHVNEMHEYSEIKCNEESLHEIVKANAIQTTEMEECFEYDQSSLSKTLHEDKNHASDISNPVSVDIWNDNKQIANQIDDNQNFIARKRLNIDRSRRKTIIGPITDYTNEEKEDKIFNSTLKKEENINNKNSIHENIHLKDEYKHLNDQCVDFEAINKVLEINDQDLIDSLGNMNDNSEFEQEEELIKEASSIINEDLTHIPKNILESENDEFKLFTHNDSHLISKENKNIHENENLSQSNHSDSETETDLNATTKPVIADLTPQCRYSFLSTQVKNHNGVIFDSLSNDEQAEFTEFCRKKLQSFTKKEPKRNAWSRFKNFFSNCYKSCTSICLSPEPKLEIHDSIYKVGEYILENGTETCGIFRLCASNTDYSRVLPFELHEGLDYDPSEHTIVNNAVLLKAYLREVLMGFFIEEIASNVLEMYKQARKEYEVSKDEKVYSNAIFYIQNIMLFTMTPGKRALLKLVFKIFKQVDVNFEKTEINVHGLSIIFGPNIISYNVFKDMYDYKFFPEIIELLYNGDMNKIDINVYEEFIKTKSD